MPVSEAVLALAGGVAPFAALACTIAAAGIVRGFTGFGTALVFMPVAGALIDPPLAVLTLVVTGMAVWPVLLPPAWGKAARGEVAVMGAAALFGVPMGVALLAALPVETLRWVVAVAAALTLAALVSGWRYTRRVGRGGLAAVGASAGLLGGATGLGGPPAILFYLAGPSGAERVRANTILFLCVLDISITVALLLRFSFGWAELAFCAVLAVPYAATTLLGQRLFRPERERAYRGAAYLLIAGAILMGLPLWS
ncbi:sulfite exporter TauE/SafE family protein [Rhodovulum sp. 12E13]|uniref:TSUP family transporter n=1 Tax=Rhodovulum sp. 12E13 TaxID=2203891 RepID=UPI000E1AA414|nr:TSUP family transporter [Rhodovulum sp. 12E13]RDC71085.1 sulfite exporter TauE/SafE family protein [Rhodovulum sp. 12E13]